MSNSRASPGVKLLAAGLALLCAAGWAGAQPFPSCDDPTQSYLLVKVISASRLPCSDTFGKPDPFVEVSRKMGNFTLTKITRTIDNSKNPTWDAVLDFGCVEPDTPVSLVVKDYDYWSDELCATLNITAWPTSAVAQETCEVQDPPRGCVVYEFLYSEASGTTGTTTTTTTTTTKPDTTTDPQQISPTPGVTVTPIILPPKTNDTTAPHSLIPPPSSTVPKSSPETPSLRPVDPVLEQPHESTKSSSPGRGGKKKKAGIIAGSVLGSLIVFAGVIAAVVLSVRRPRGSSALQLDETGREGQHVGNLRVAEDGPAIAVL